MTGKIVLTKWRVSVVVTVLYALAAALSMVATVGDPGAQRAAVGLNVALWLGSLWFVWRAPDRGTRE